MQKNLAAIIIWFASSLTSIVFGQSVARQWNEVLLEAIRNDLARPTVHARNLFHTSAAMYDAWAAYEDGPSTYFLSHEHRGYFIPFENAKVPSSMAKTEAQEIAISYAAYRLILHRFGHSPGAEEAQRLSDNLMTRLGLDHDHTSTAEYQSNPADLGNYIAEQVILFGLRDGANEISDYANREYEPVNEPMYPDIQGIGTLVDPNRWQPLSFEQFIGQSGIAEESVTPEFVGPEWGQVVPFALTEDELTIKKRNDYNYMIYHDPGPPVYLDSTATEEENQLYRWNFSLVAQWSSHLNPNDGVNWDISPASIGNIALDDLPSNADELTEFYDFEDGGDISPGYYLNPITGEPYEPQIVPRADYARVLAEFWADGPDSETPPGHWFVILNYVNDHPDFERKYKGSGEAMDELEWNIKSYFALGGGVHDAAVSAWGVKGYYDFIRPISAIRRMAVSGQCSDPNLPNYSSTGIPLIPGQIEMITADDPLNEFGDIENEIKIKGWKIPGRYYVGSDPDVNVDWIRGDLWQPYQRPTFVTPPFAGYVSGHSTFSRAAAEILTELTGSGYFPGGMGEFQADKDQFLVFEVGPSTDVTLQWARYQDASDQCSLSRIWGGIHPPVDDIPGRRMGYAIGKSAFALADKYFNGEIEDETAPAKIKRSEIGPNPILGDSDGTLRLYMRQPSDLNKQISIYDVHGNLQFRKSIGYIQFYDLYVHNLPNGIYFLTIETDEYLESHRFAVQR